MGANMNNVQDLDFSVLHKQKFRIDGDDNRILELDVADFSVLNRLEDSYPKLKEMQEEAVRLQQLSASIGNLEDSEDDVTGEAPEELTQLSNQLKVIDQKMRDWIDYVFDTNASEVIVQSGTMYDVIGGQYRYEIIIDKLIAAYESNIKKETTKMKNRLNNYLKDHKRKGKS